ncbi:AIDA autotransporter-like protein ShdA [Salmonella enterica subsp. enterica serovar Typhi]|nr:AIDA autotransporter-like protein ShdA [Salmonella enterica subsp. enterica serovar Typhi]CIL85626.1 AIDA autotransporter-like protein ShdA [Salmonella enterica subsp. enterica serovar Typhi]CIL90745.1 AIDA autotransporter-like protein ShdA [Salmonella enterica subsp. enterica serovar Typhi]CIM04111.1 AIDA autotransporter-like protein ShdA [Salmonella enterica subsp. enterica serovar Typhi]CIM15428.1 AIDA autotransporter-like protein ShdA [Salmonella enterica subsp. enterica serovar Typhi]
MNRTYSIVWSAVRNMYVVASELARSHSKVKIQAHANEVAPSIKKPDSGWARHHALALAIVAALGFASPLAIADNPVSYTDGVKHDLSDDSPISYSGTGEGSALHLEGLATPEGGWQATSGTGTNVVINTNGGGDPVQGTHAIATAVTLNKGATLDLTGAQISTEGTYTAGIDLQAQSSMTLNGGSIQIGSNYGILTLSGESWAALIGTDVTATTQSRSSIVSQSGSTLNIKDGSVITLTNGQVRVVGETTYNSWLNVSDSTMSSTGTDSTLLVSNKGVLDITNSTVTHDNATGAAIEVKNASTVSISDDKDSMAINSKGIGIKILASSVDINGATINADGDGIFITSKGKSGGYDDINALTVNKAQVNSETIALHVDSGTTINDPIVLTDSAFDAPAVIKLGSKAVIQADNTTLNGDVVQSDMSSSSLSLSQGSTLTGSVDAMFTTLSLDDTSQWNMTDSSIIGNLTNNGDITLNNESGSTGTLLTVGNTLTLQDGSQINATLDTANSSPIIKAANVTLDGTLNLSSAATFVAPETDEQLGSFTLIDSQTAITTDFDSVTLDVDTSAMPDYLTINAGVDANDNTNYVLSTGLSWYADAKSARVAHGTFTVDAGDTFTVTSELDETAATSNWDGKTLFKEGDGTLVLSNTANDFGNTDINGGTLSANDAAALGSGDVAIAENAKLELSQGTLDNNVTGEGQIVKSGSDELIVTGDNNYSGGTTISDGTLIADHADSLGTGAVANSGVLQVGEGELENTLSGNGSLMKTGTGELTLSGDNTYSGGTTISGGTLIAANVNALGGGDVDNASTLKLDAEGEFNLANVTTQSGATTELSKGTTLNVDSLTQQADSTLNIDLSKTNGESAITADSVSLAGALNITGIGNVTDSWTPEAYTYTLIDSDSAITTDFNDLTVAGMNSEDVDFLTIDGKVDEADSTNYDLTASLSWYADRDNASTDAHGTFTLSDPDGSFNVAAKLTDVDDALDPGSTWDGKSLTKEGAGTLILSGDNDYSGGTTINEGTLVAASTTALGTGLVDNNATLVLDADGEVSAVGGITTHGGATTQLALGTSLDLGDSALIQEDGSTLNVELNSDSAQPLITGGSATLGGDLVVSDASLQARASDAEFQSFKLMDMDSDISGDFTSLTMNLTDKPDYLTVTGTINPQDQSEYLLTEGLSWNATATSATPAHGTFTLGAGDSFEVTSVLGDKTGNGGSLYLNTVLGDDDSATDKLVITGDASGTTDLYINGIGDGAQTTNGIEVVDVGGVSTSDAFVLKNEVNASLYTYRLYWNESDNDWYLASKAQSDDDDSGGDVTPSDDGGDGGDVTPPDDGGDVAPQYRADIGAYMGNQWMARNLQMQTDPL